MPLGMVASRTCEAGIWRGEGMEMKLAVNLAMSSSYPFKELAFGARDLLTVKSLAWMQFLVDSYHRISTVDLKSDLPRLLHLQEVSVCYRV